MGPSTFSAYCSAILLGFNSIAVDQKAKTFLKHAFVAGLHATLDLQVLF